MDAQNRVAYPWRDLNFLGNSSEGHQIALGGSERYTRSSQASKSSSPAALLFSFLPAMFLPSSWTRGHYGKGIWDRRPSEGNMFGFVGTQGCFTGESATDISEVTPRINPVVEEIGDNVSHNNLTAGTTLNDCSISVLLREDACWWDGTSWFDHPPKPVYSEGTIRKFVHDSHAIRKNGIATDHEQESLVEHQEPLEEKGPAVQFQQILQTLQVPCRKAKSTTPLLLDSTSQSVRLVCGPGAIPVEAVFAASTSGRVESEFWNGRRKGCCQSLSSPTGVLYLVDPDKDIFAFSALEQGRKLEENTSIGDNHSVSTCFEQGGLGVNKSIWMSTSHKLDANNILATHYANDLKGGADFTFNTSHVIVPASRLSTCFHTASLGDPTLEVELEQEKERKNLIANLRTGDRLLRLQSKKTLKHNVTLSNSYMTNLSGQHSVRLEAAVPIFGSGHISNSFTTDFRESHEVCVKGQQRIGDRNTLGTSFTTNLDQSNQICVEAKHVAQDALDVAIKVTNDMSGSTQLNVTTSHTRQHSRWGWNYRRASGEAQSLGVEWRHEVAQDKFLSVRASTRDWTSNIYAELRIPF